MNKSTITLHKYNHSFHLISFGSLMKTRFMKPKLMEERFPYLILSPFTFQKRDLSIVIIIIVLIIIMVILLTIVINIIMITNQVHHLLARGQHPGNGAEEWKLRMAGGKPTQFAKKDLSPFIVVTKKTQKFCYDGILQK